MSRTWTAPWRASEFFRRTFRLSYLSEMPESVQRRLYLSSLLLRQEEDRVRDLLELPISPRLSLVDEESGALITGSERAVLEQRRDEDDKNDKERRQAEREAESRKREGGWRGGQ